MTFDDIIQFPYKLDEFQSKSINAIRNDSHVLVTAHTSAGKSTVAEYAIAHARYYKKRVIYTSPIKALSNQKYSDFKKKYKGFQGSKGESVGIMTGDIKVCPDAPILVATTEIVNNLLYTNPDYFDDVFAIIFVIRKGVTFGKRSLRSHLPMYSWSCYPHPFPVHWDLQNG
jgi:superfamily II RNA helicase